MMFSEAVQETALSPIPDSLFSFVHSKMQSAANWRPICFFCSKMMLAELLFIIFARTICVGRSQLAQNRGGNMWHRP